jgi:hypothetical protein
VPNGRAGKCCAAHDADERLRCCKHCPMEPKHLPQPVWRSIEGQQYCNRFSKHGEWVAWPCEKAA